MIAKTINNNEFVYRRFHKSKLASKLFFEIIVSKDKKTGKKIIHKDISVNWCKFCKEPEKARNKANKPKENGVVIINVGDVRNECESILKHSPSIRSLDWSHASIIPIVGIEKIMTDKQYRLNYYQKLAEKSEIILKPEY